MNLGEFVKDRMSELGIKACELATRSGLTPAQISKILSRGEIPRQEVAKKLSLGLGVEIPQELLTPRSYKKTKTSETTTKNPSTKDVFFDMLIEYIKGRPGSSIKIEAQATGMKIEINIID